MLHLMLHSLQPSHGAVNFILAQLYVGVHKGGRLKFEEKNGYPVHAVSLVDHQTGIVLSQGHVEKTDVEPKEEPTAMETKSTLTEEQEQEAQEEKKEKSELAVASRLIQHIDWKGKVLTGDALYCQRWLCSALRLAGGDYVFLVKGNQPHCLKMCACYLHRSHLQNERVRGVCDYLSNTLKRRRRRMDVWTCEVFGFLRSLRATPIGLV